MDCSRANIQGNSKNNINSKNLYLEIFLAKFDLFLKIYHVIFIVLIRPFFKNINYSQNL